MLSRLIRRTHMYAALALCPWVLMYALSTLVMNHRAWFAEPGAAPAFSEERRLDYDGVLPTEAPPRVQSEQLLASLGLNGAHTVNRRADGTLVINRADLLTPRRITYQPATHTVVVERQEWSARTLLERFHRRRGYATGYRLDTLWAVTVDLFIAGMLLWACSGLWMWWEMKVTRGAGALAILTGLALFATFLAAI